MGPGFLSIIATLWKGVCHVANTAVQGVSVERYLRKAPSLLLFTRTKALILFFSNMGGLPIFKLVMKLFNLYCHFDIFKVRLSGIVIPHVIFWGKWSLDHFGDISVLLMLSGIVR